MLALELFGAPFSLIALIGIMLLIGIVEEKRHHDGDFALEAQRNGNLTPEEYFSSPAAFSSDHDDHAGGAVWRVAAGDSGGDGSELRQPLGITIVGGLSDGQLLTLHHHAGGLSVL